MPTLLSLLRVRVYLKNGFVLLGLLFTETWTAKLLLNAGMMFAAFCSMSSTIYIVNDIRDRDNDRLHPIKHARAVASGLVSLRSASIAAVALAVVSMSLTLWVGLPALIFIALYALMNLAYTRWWQHIPIVDVFVVATGIVLRILGGALGIGITPSSWILICGLMLSFFLGFAKRHHELGVIESYPEDHPLSEAYVRYTRPLMEQFLSICAACVIIISYSIYASAPQTVIRHHTGHLTFTVPFVVYCVFRYLYVMQRNQHLRFDGLRCESVDPFADLHILLALLGWSFTTLLVLA